MANNKLKKIIAAMLALSVTMSHGAVLNVFAEGEVLSGSAEGEIAEEAPAGTSEDPIIEIIETSFIDEEGNSVEQTETNKEWKDVEGETEPLTEDGQINNTVTEGQETTVEQTSTSPNGLHIEESGNINGSETVTETTVTQETTKQILSAEDGMSYLESEAEVVEESIDEEGTTVENSSSEETEISFEEPGDMTLELTPGSSDSVSESLAIDYDESRIPEAVDEDIVDEEGNVTGHKTVTVEKIKDENGNVIGYSSEETVISYGEKELLETEYSEWEEDSENADSFVSAPVTERDEAIVTIELPEKPEESESYDELSGQTTKTSVVEEKDENGNVIGYTTVKETFNAEGNWVKSEIETVYGTVTTKQVERVTTKTFDQTDEPEVEIRTVTRTYSEPYSVSS